jgi:hypothetical protein
MTSDASTGTTPPTVPPAASTAAIEAAVAKVQLKLQHPDVWQRALSSYVLSEWMTALVESGQAGLAFTLPITTSSVQTKSTSNDDGSAVACHDTSISILGHQILQWGSCVETMGTGTAHLNAEVLSVGPG